MPISHSDHRYRRLFETINVGIILLNFKNRVITDVNPAMAHLSGFKITEMIGKKISELEIFEKGFTGKKIFAELKKEKEVTYEVKLVSKKGHQRIVEVSAHTYESDDQTMVQCTVHDLTERLQAQSDLFESTQRLEALMNALPIGVAYSTDVKCEEIKANPYLARKMEMPIEANISATTPDPRAAGRRLRHFSNGKQIPAKDLPMQRAVREKRIVGPFEIEVELPSGKHWLMEAYGAPVRDQRGTVVGAVAVNIDLTERKKAEQAEKLSQLVAQEKEKVSFIADAAHELRTPLAIIRGNVELAIRDERLSKNALPAINVEVLHLTNLLSDLALLTTRESEFRRKLRSNKVAVGKLVASIAKRHEGMAHKKNIQISIGKLPPNKIVGDEYYLERLFTNIISNAISYGKENGHVWVSGDTKNGQIRIRIKDDGIGISETDVPHVFDRFYRTDSSRSKDSGGSGLGLAIVKWIAEAHGGSVGVESTLGQGSTFSICMPLSSSSKLV